MNATPALAPKRPQRPLPRIDLGILAIHGLLRRCRGIIGFIDVSEGRETLQRIGVPMQVSLWLIGIVAMAAWLRSSRIHGHA